MGFLTLINFSKKEQICIGRSGEEPIIQILKQMQLRFKWNLEQDLIEVCDDENVSELGWKQEIYTDDEEDDDSDSECVEVNKAPKFIDRGINFGWKERQALWNLMKKCVVDVNPTRSTLKRKATDVVDGDL